MNVEINSYADLRLDVLKFVYFFIFLSFYFKSIGKYSKCSVSCDWWITLWQVNVEI